MGIGYALLNHRDQYIESFTLLTSFLFAKQSEGGIINFEFKPVFQFNKDKTGGHTYKQYTITAEVAISTDLVPRMPAIYVMPNINLGYTILLADVGPYRFIQNDRYLSAATGLTLAGDLTKSLLAKVSGGLLYNFQSKEDIGSIEVGMMINL